MRRVFVDLALEQGEGGGQDLAQIHRMVQITRVRAGHVLEVAHDLLDALGTLDDALKKSRQAFQGLGHGHAAEAEVAVFPAVAVQNLADVLPTARQDGGVEVDCVVGVVDFMGDAGGQDPERGQAGIADGVGLQDPFLGDIREDDHGGRHLGPLAQWHQPQVPPGRVIPRVPKALGLTQGQNPAQGLIEILPGPNREIALRPPFLAIRRGSRQGPVE